MHVLCGRCYESEWGFCLATKSWHSFKLLMISISLSSLSLLLSLQFFLPSFSSHSVLDVCLPLIFRGNFNYPSDTNQTEMT